eukprot:scaffold7902_cov129-Cylindrotheca_fusiformis.AAC.7
MENRNKRKRFENGRQGRRSKWFVCTRETKCTDIPEQPLNLRVGSSRLVHVQLPETLERIGKLTFSQCSNLKSVQVVANDASLGNSTIIGPNFCVDDGAIMSGVKTMLYSEIGKWAFRDCGCLIFVHLPDGLEIIQDCVFSGCKSLTTVKIPSSVIKIGEGAFRGCRKLSSFDLSNGLLEIGGRSFEECRSIVTLPIPSTVHTIGWYAFSGCWRLTVVTLPPALEIIAFGLFSECNMLKYIEIPSTVHTIGEHAFHHCRSLSHIRIPPKVTGIPNYAFEDCGRLISIELPKQLFCWARESQFPSFLADLAFPPKRRAVFSVYYPHISPSFAAYGNLRSVLYQRFDNSPLTKLCYYHSYYSLDEAMANLHDLMDPDPLAATKQVDAFGMTPLHILSLSQTPNMSMLLAVINGGHPDHMFRCRDKFLASPLDYLTLNRMPNSVQVIRKVVQTRLGWLGLDRWKSNIMQAIDKALAVKMPKRKTLIDEVYFRIDTYERMEIVSWTELYLWNVTIEEVRSRGQSTDRQSCRIKSGASIVIPHVLPFLGKLNKDDYLITPGWMSLFFFDDIYGRKHHYDIFN